MARLRSLPTWLKWLLLAAAYLAAARIGLAIPWVHQGVSPLWPPTGLAVAALLICGYSVWPGIVLGAFALLIGVFHFPLLPALLIPLGNALEALVGVYLLRRLGAGEDFLERPADVVKYIACVGFVGTAVGTANGALTLCMSGLASWSVFGALFGKWWLGDAIGALTVAPVIVSLVRQSPVGWSNRKFVEAIISALLVLTVSMVTFGGWLFGHDQHYPLAFLPLPFLAMAALRLGPIGATTSVLLTAAIAVVGTALGFGPFDSHSPLVTLMLLSAYITVCALSNMLFSAVKAERRRAQKELARSNEELRKAYADLQELDRLKDSLLSSFSHEIKTPISLLVAYAELLQDKHPDEELLSGIQEGSRRLTEQLNRILDYNALLSGSLQLYKTEVGLGELVEIIQTAMAQDLQSAGLEFRSEIDPATPPIQADTRRVMQVLVELVDNARKFTSPGGAITLRVRPVSEAVRLEVCDTGHGIPAEHFARIWEASNQLETTDAGSKGGLGLGLTIVKLLADLHGGRAEVRSKVGIGSCFLVDLPVESELVPSPRLAGSENQYFD